MVCVYPTEESVYRLERCESPVFCRFESQILHIFFIRKRKDLMREKKFTHLKDPPQHRESFPSKLFYFHLGSNCFQIVAVSKDA